jgi:hypothetical protein
LGRYAKSLLQIIVLATARSRERLVEPATDPNVIAGRGITGLHKTTPCFLEVLGHFPDSRASVNQFRKS